MNHKNLEKSFADYINRSDRRKKKSADFLKEIKKAKLKVSGHGRREKVTQETRVGLAGADRHIGTVIESNVI